ncbi:SulP family inorganic anion transporter [Cereibacter sp. SYSU M97828]|nr:SulP family inorganic anion transporter [Cereibacter flavus]
MIPSTSYVRQWTGNLRGDLLAGVVVALALIPEAIAFSLIAGVDPKVGLYASFAIAVVTAIAGGRPAMISASTAATAVLMVTLVRDHGLQYLLAASILAGVIQIGIGAARLGQMMRFVSRSVMTGFVNSLAILMTLSQIPELWGVPMLTYPVVAAGVAIILLFPRITTAIPAPLVCVAVLTAGAAMLGLDLRTVGDKGALPDTLPVFLLPDIPLTLETLKIILPYSAAIAVVGLLESLLTQNLLDDMTETVTSRDRECVGQGLANMTSGFIGGMAGCAVIGQSLINVKSGGRGRLSCFFAGVMVLVFCVFLGPWVAQIPMAALVAVMLVIAAGTFDWGSILNIRRMPVSSSVVMLATMGIVVWTHNLALGTLAGVLLSGIFFAWKISHLFHVESVLEGGVRHYRFEGQMFFASAETFMRAFDFNERPARVVIDLSRAHIWDISSVAALKQVVARLGRGGTEVEVIGMNRATQTLVDRLGPSVDAAK